MQSRKKGLVLSYSFFALSGVVNVFLSSFVIRTVGKTDYGIYQSVAAFINYLTLLEFGTGRVLSRNISMMNKDGTDANEIKKNISTVMALNGFLMLLILVCAVFFWLSIDKVYQNSMSTEQIALAKRLFVFPVFSLGISFFQQSLNGILIGYENYTLEKIISIGKLIIKCVLVVVLLTVQCSIYLYVIADTFANCLALIATAFYIRAKLNVPLHPLFFDKRILISILPLCFAMLLQGIVGAVNNVLDKFLISIMLTPEDVTIYSVALTIYSMFSTIGCLPMGMYMPLVAKNMKQGLKGKALTQSLLQPCRLNILIMGVIAAGFIVAGRQFITVIYGRDFLAAWYCAILVLIPSFLNMANDIVINVLDILNKRHIRSIILMGTTMLNFVMTICGIKYIGIIGASLATGIATLLQAIILNYYYHTKIGIDIKYLFKYGFAGIMPSILAALLVTLPLYVLIGNTVLSFVSCGCVFVLAFGIIYIFWGTNSFEKQQIRKIAYKLKH